MVLHTKIARQKKTSGWNITDGFIPPVIVVYIVNIFLLSVKADGRYPLVTVSVNMQASVKCRRIISVCKFVGDTFR